jgi:hypothetical protein
MFFCIKGFGIQTNKHMTTSASLCEGPVFYFYVFTFLLSQSIPTLPQSWQASCGEERSRHICPVEYEWAWIIIVDLTLEVNMLGGKYKPLSFSVSGQSFLFMRKPWVLAIMKDWMMVEYVDLLKSSYLWLFLKIMMNCSCKVDWKHSLLVSNKFYASYFNAVMNCYLCMRDIWCKSYEKSLLFLVPCCYNNEHDASMSVSCFYRLLPLSKHVGMFARFRFSLEDKRGLSLGELIRPFCIMFSYCCL